MKMQELKTQIESLIDSNSVAIILEAMAQVCNEKAQHIEENWQDKNTARIWDNTGFKLRTLSDKIAC